MRHRISYIGRPVEIGSRFSRIWGNGEWLLVACCFFEEWWKWSKINCGIAHLCEHINKNHWIVPFKGVNYMGLWVTSVKLLKRKRWFTFKGRLKTHHPHVINNLTTAWSTDCAIHVFIPVSLLCMPRLYMFLCTNWCSQYISVHLEVLSFDGTFYVCPLPSNHGTSRAQSS